MLIQGLVAIIALVRDKNIGVQVFANLDGAELRHAIIYKVFDLLLFDDKTIFFVPSTISGKSSIVFP